MESWITSKKSKLPFKIKETYKDLKWTLEYSLFDEKKQKRIRFKLYDKAADKLTSAGVTLDKRETLFYILT